MINKYAAKVFSSTKEKYNYKVLQIYCDAQVEALYNRYKNRDNSGERHPGHIVEINGLEEFKKRVYSKNFKLDIDGSTNIDLDTTNFENTKLEEIYAFIGSVFSF